MYEEPVVTLEDVMDFYRSRGWPTFDDIRYDHLKPDEVAIMETAVDAAKGFINDVINGRQRALILHSHAVTGVDNKTGYGCGKSFLASIVRHRVAEVRVGETIEDLSVSFKAAMHESRTVMGWFDDPNFSLDTYMANLWLLVIDDVGREGTLRWEGRRLEQQANEKHERYYSLVNYCYQNNKSLLLTTNLTNRELGHLIGLETWDRILHLSPKSYRVDMTGLPTIRPILGEE